MTYEVHQHWDPLKVCAVGRSYPPEFYNFISNSRVRSVMERIAQETEEDYQKLINLLESFGVDVVRTDISDNFESYKKDGRYLSPPMCPRDYTAMIGNTFYMPTFWPIDINWDAIRGVDWPNSPPNDPDEYDLLSTEIKTELTQRWAIDYTVNPFRSIWELIKSQGNKIIYSTGINTAEVSRIGKDLYFGTPEGFQHDDIPALQKKYATMFPNYRNHVINTGGHSDSTFCPVVPGLVVSRYDIPTYAETFPNWEIIYLPNKSWEGITPFLDLKEKNRGKWWVPGEELNNDFTEFVESWLDHWVGYVEETVFDVNMLVINEKNVLCNNYNETVFKTFERFGITPHVINFRHRYFWDGGLHCITSDLHREGIQKDYFLERG